VLFRSTEAGDLLAARVTRDALGQLLTPREREILGLIGDGMTSGQIAEHLSRSVKTVEWHRVSIGRKLGIKTRVGLTHLALRAGLSRAKVPESTPRTHRAS